MFIQVTTMYSGDKDSAGLSRGGMVLVDEVLLTDGDEMGHLEFDEVPDPDCAEVSATCM